MYVSVAYTVYTQLISTWPLGAYTKIERFSIEHSEYPLFVPEESTVVGIRI